MSTILSEAETKITAIDKFKSIIEFNNDGTVINANKNFLNIFNYELEEIKGKHHSFLLDPSYKKSSEYASFWNRLTMGIPDSGEFRYIAKSGKDIWLQSAYIPLIDSNGKTFKIITISTDITKRKSEAAELDSVFARCKAIELAVNAHSLISFANVQGKIIYVNDLFCNTSKYSREELIGKDHAILNSGYHPKGFFAEMYRTVGKGQIWKGEVRNRAKDSTYYWVATTILPIFDADGKLHQYISIRMNITEQKLKNIDFSGQLAAISRSQMSLELNMDGTVVNANTNFLESLGYSLDEIVGKHHSIFVDHNQRKSQEYKNFWEKLNQGLFEAAEYKRIGKNGKEVWIQAAYNPILDLNGKPSKVVEYATDITLQKKNIEDSKASTLKAMDDLNRQNKVRASVEELSNSIRGELGISELGDNILSSFAKLIGTQVGALYVLTNDRLELIATYAYKKRKNLSNVFEIGEGLVGQCAREKKTIVISNIPDDYIKVTSGLGDAPPNNIIVLPITFEKRLMGILEIGKIGSFSDEEIKIIEACVENMGVTINSANAREQMQNLLKESKRQAAELQSQQEELKATNEELASQQLALSKSNIALEEQAERLKKSEAHISRKNEELKRTTLSLEKQAAEIEEKSALVEEAKRSIEAKARELEISNKYKSEFLANMSHELRTPLNSLLILSRILANNEEGNLTPDQIESAKIIHRGGSDLLALINDILDLSKVEAGKLEINLEDVSINTIIDNVYKQFKPIAQDKGLKFIENNEVKHQLVLTDIQRAEQVLKNFLSNAFKFTREGSVTIKIHHVDPKTVFQRNSLNKNNCIAVSIIDTGIGIPKDKQKLIFEAFQQGDGRTSRVFGGTGLGLSISQELARILGCEIQLESQEGQGSTFTLYIPKNSGSKEREQEYYQRETNQTYLNYVKEKSIVQPVKQNEMSLSIADDSLSLQKNDTCLLIIEDDPKYARILMDFSRKRGYKCILATSGKMGLQYAKQYTPCAITLDMNLPDMHGDEILELLKLDPSTANIPVHIVSASEEKFNFKQKGAISYLKKSENIEELEDLFSQLQSGEPGRIKRVLVIEDDKNNQEAILKLLKSKSLTPTIVASGIKACQMIARESYDCIILDLNLPDTTGFHVLKNLSEDNAITLPPIIIYTGRELTKEEYHQLNEHTPSVIVKGPSSEERLIDELTIFLHSVETTSTEIPNKLNLSNHDSQNILQNKKVLVVDDDMRNTFALTAVLRKKGLQVTMAENGEKAIEKLNNEQDMDIVIMDIMMPIMDGYEAMKHIRKEKRFSNLPIIALTAKVLPEDKAKALDSGANDFMTKPVDIERLLNLMSVWLYETINQ